MQSGARDARAFLAYSLIGLCALVVGAHADSAPAEKPAQGKAILEAAARLDKGNKRYVEGKLGTKDFAKERQALAQSQHPYAIIVSCSDSRVPPELVFDETLGRLFVVRVAGTVMDPAVLGSIEYAAEHLGVGLLVVLGHERCGAVKATLEGGHVPANVAKIAEEIAPAAKVAKSKKLDATGTLDAAIHENVRLQMKRAADESTLIRELVEKKTLWIVGGVYDLDSGKVEWLE